MAIAPAVVAYLNFVEVVSRRMLYRNSSASMFEEQFKYSIAVFFDSAAAITLFILSIIWQIYAAPYLLQSSFKAICNTQSAFFYKIILQISEKALSLPSNSTHRLSVQKLWGD